MIWYKYKINFGETFFAKNHNANVLYGDCKNKSLEGWTLSFIVCLLRDTFSLRWCPIKQEDNE